MIAPGNFKLYLDDSAKEKAMERTDTDSRRWARSAVTENYLETSVALKL